MDDAERRKLRHDILGCLNSIKLSMEVIRMSRDQEEVVQFLDCVVGEVGKVESMVNTLANHAPDSTPRR